MDKSQTSYVEMTRFRVGNTQLRQVKEFAFDDLPATDAGVILKDGTELRSHLVVDASGRSTSIPKWLGQNGFEVPRTIVVDPHVNSVSRVVKMPFAFEQVHSKRTIFMSTSCSGFITVLFRPSRAGLESFIVQKPAVWPKRRFSTPL